MSTDSIKRASSILGGTVALADAAGVKPPTVSQWLTGIRRVPLERCPLIESATRGAVTVEELRPDVDWAVIRGRTPPALPSDSVREAA